MLSSRPVLCLDRWCDPYCQSFGIAPAVATFAYTYLEQYSGLQIARVLPSDLLDGYLCWTDVCWFDWEISLCEDFLGCFGVDISDRLDQFHPSTMLDLLLFLHQALLSSGATDCETEVNFTSG